MSRERVVLDTNVLISFALSPTAVSAQAVERALAIFFIAAIAMRSLAGVILKGRPPALPRARAEASPAMVRSRISSRSYSASAAKILNKFPE